MSGGGDFDSSDSDSGSSWPLPLPPSPLLVPSLSPAPDADQLDTSVVLLASRDAVPKQSPVAAYYSTAALPTLVSLSDSSDDENGDASPLSHHTNNESFTSLPPCDEYYALPRNALLASLGAIPYSLDTRNRTANLSPLLPQNSPSHYVEWPTRRETSPPPAQLQVQQQPPQTPQQQQQQTPSKRQLAQLNRRKTKREYAQELELRLHPALLTTESPVSDGIAAIITRLEALGVKTTTDASLPCTNSAVFVRWSATAYHQTLPVLEKPHFVIHDAAALLQRVRQDPTYKPTILAPEVPCCVILLGFDAWRRRMRRARGRQSNFGTNRPEVETIDYGEAAALEIVQSWRLLWNLHVLLPTSREDAVQHFESFACEIGAFPYISGTHDNDDVCTQVYIKSGAGLEDTWRQMLLAIRNLSGPTANAIIAIYPTVAALTETYKRDPSSGPTLLENIMVDRSLDSTRPPKRLGPALSRKIHCIFTATDPDYEPYEQQQRL